MEKKESEEHEHRDHAMPAASVPDDDGDESGERKSKKKTRLQWDEENLTLNALEMERHPKMKIDEPKTPFAQPASEAGSSTSGSAPSSPAPYFIPKDRLTGFQALEKAAAEQTGSTAGPNGYFSITRSVQIVDEREPSGAGSSSVSNVEFESKRRKHYANEAALMRTDLSDEADNVDSKEKRSVQIVDEREPAVDSSPPQPNVEFEARRRNHYANEARLMRSEWEEERGRGEEAIGSGEQVGTAVESVESMSNGVRVPSSSEDNESPAPNGISHD